MTDLALVITATDLQGMDKMDGECIALCRAINMIPGIYTIESCCRHGEGVFRVWFKATNLRVLPNLLYWADGCHSGVYGWSVVVTTDCAKSPVTFCLQSTAKGSQAYEEANRIAQMIISDVKEADHDSR